jgi:hypothetical protein
MLFKPSWWFDEAPRFGKAPAPCRGCYLKREDGSHSLWTNPRTGVVEGAPRHTKIKEPLAWKTSGLLVQADPANDLLLAAGLRPAFIRVVYRAVV